MAATSSCSATTRRCWQRPRTGWSRRSGTRRDAGDMSLTLSLPCAALSIAALDDLDHDGVVRFVGMLEESGHRMVWVPEVAGREAFTTAALVLCATRRMIVGNGVARALERVPTSAAPAAQAPAPGHPGRHVRGLGVTGAAREPG